MNSLLISFALKNPANMITACFPFPYSPLDSSWFRSLAEREAEESQALLWRCLQWWAEAGRMLLASSSAAGTAASLVQLHSELCQGAGAEGNWPYFFASVSFHTDPVSWPGWHSESLYCHGDGLRSSWEKGQIWQLGFMLDKCTEAVLDS